jgi:hypothetical protein
MNRSWFLSLLGAAPIATIPKPIHTPEPKPRDAELYLLHSPSAVKQKMWYALGFQGLHYRDRVRGITGFISLEACHRLGFWADA